MPSGVRPLNTFVHEFAHALDAARYSALQAANPSGFVDSLVDDVLSNSFSGKTSIWDKPGAQSTGEMIYTRLKTGEGGLSDADVNFARQMLGDYLRQNQPQGTLPQTPTQEALSAWISERGGKFPDSKQEAALLREMVREISHANIVMSESMLGTAAMNDAAMQKMVQAFSSVQGSDPVVFRHAMRGISDATSALADGNRYDFGSRYENRANRFQAREIIEATQNSLPGLTSELRTLIAGNPQFAALNAKLETLSGSSADKSVRRAGVRQSEFFSSAEGKAELARLKENASTREISERIEANTAARQNALSTQRFLTALDMLPSHRATLDSAADSSSRQRAQQAFDSTLQSLIANAKVEDLPRLAKFLETDGLASADQVRDAFAKAGVQLPAPVEVPQVLSTAAGRWNATLDSLSALDRTSALARFRGLDANSEVATDIERTVSDWKPAAQKFDNLRIVQARAEHAAKQEEAWKALGADAEAQTQYWANFKKEMEATAASISQELSPEILQRAEALQSTLNQGLAASNLPPATIVVASTGSSIAFGAQSPAARYNPETGKIEVSPASLLSASPEKISASIRTEYEKSLAHRFSVESAGNQNLSNAQRDAAARVSDMFAQQASANARVQQLEKRAEMLADNQRLLLSEGGVRTLLGRISAPGADAESILGVAPPPELNNLLARFQNARKRDGSLDSKKWSMESDQEVSRLLFPSVYKASVQARTELQRVSSDGPATAGELAYDRASIDTRFEDAIAATDFSPDYGTQMEQRIGLAMDYSWALPDRASLSAIYDFAGKEGVVEVGAGKGLWAGALRRMGLDVAAYDINANNVDNNAYHRGESVSTVEEGGTDKAGEHPNKTLLLSYPTPGDSMATDALKAYTEAGGTKLAFIGERPTPGSELFNTGDKQFHETIDNDWVLTGVVDIPHVPDGTNLNTSKLYLYERRGVSLDLQKESKLPDGPASAAEILDRAAVNGDLPSKHRAVYEKALEDGILKPAQLSAIFSSMGSVNREVVVLPLLSSGKLTETGAATLVSLRNSQLSSISEMGSQRLDSLVELMNSPQITRLDIGNFLSLPELQRSTFESLLFGAKPLPKPEVSAKILRMSHDTAADLEKMIDVLPTQRQAVLDFIGTKGPGEISFAALISSRPHLASDKATAVLNATVRNADIVRNAEQKARADRELSLVADAIRSLDTTDAVRLLNELSSGTITTTEVARFQDAAQKGLIGNSLISMKNVLFSHAQMRSTLSSMLEVDGMFSGQLSLGPSGVDQVLRRSNGIAAAVSNGLTSHAELHSLLTGSPADAVAAEIILGQPRAAAGLTRPTVEGLVAASKDGTISVSDMESIRLALAEGVLTESALKGLLSQPANVRSNLSHQFSQLWHMRHSTHESHLEHPVDTRTDSFIESENRKFIDQYVSALATNPEGGSVLRMGAGRLSEFLTPLIPELEPALSKSTPLLLRDAFDGAPAEVRAFTEALSSGNLRKSIELAMAEMTSCSNQFTSVRIDFNDLSNPNRISAAIEKMDQIGFARGYEGRGESVQVADLARPVVILPNGKSVDISGPKLTLLDGAPTPQDLKFIELLENDPAIRILRGRVALIAFEERLIHSHQGVGGAQSPLVEDSFKQSEEYTKMQNFYRERSADLQQAMREIDVAARLVESGMSLDDVRELMGSRHLSGEREYFYDWFARAHPDRVLPETAARTSTRPELMKESKLYQPPFESERSTKLRARVEKVPEDLRASFDALMRVAKTDAHYDNIENLLATDPAKMSAELKQFMDPKLIKTMKSNIFGFIKEAARQGSASDIANVAASDLQVIDSEIDRDFETASALLWSETPRGISQALSELDPGSVDDFKHHHLTDYADALSESGIEVTEFLGVGFESVAFRAPDGNVVKITRTEQLRSGEWNEDWGNRPFDAEILGEVETFDVPEGQIAVYKQPFVEMGVVENYPDEWKAFQAELRHAGMDFWDDGFKGDQVGVVKDKRGRARVVLIDYPSVTPGGK